MLVVKGKLHDIHLLNFDNVAVNLPHLLNCKSVYPYLCWAVMSCGSCRLFSVRAAGQGKMFQRPGILIISSCMAAVTRCTFALNLICSRVGQFTSFTFAHCLCSVED